MEAPSSGDRPDQDDPPLQDSPKQGSPTPDPPRPGPPKKPGDGPPRRGKRPGSSDDEPPRTAFSGPWLLLLILGVILLVFFFRPGAERGSRVSFSTFLRQLDQNNIAEAKWATTETLTGKWKQIPPETDAADGEKFTAEFHTVIVAEDDRKAVTETLRALVKTDRSVRYDGDATSVGMGTTFMFWMLGPLLLIGFFWFMMRRSSDPLGSGMMGNFIRSPARKFQASEHPTTFSDVAAMEQAKAELQEIVEFLKSPERFQKLGATIPKGVLLVGPPGTGKTLLARATAGEAGVPFYSISGSEFIQMFVGVGASRVRDLFRTAKENAPCILFIDEIDAVGRIRGAGLGGGHDEREQTLNQILSEMDGFTPTETVIVLAATNRPDVLDPALLRPGRFDRHITIDRPSRDGRLGILKVHCRKVPLGEDVELSAIAAGTIGFSGADLRNLVNEAAINATRNDRATVLKEDFDVAFDRISMGTKREDVLNEHERRMTAYHEAGHALIAWLLPDTDPLHKVSIIPRGQALGVTQLLPDEDRHHIGEKRLYAWLTLIMGGRASEKLVFDEFSAGAEDDLKKATQLARRMVAHWGMSEVVGPVAFRHGEEHPFLGREIHEQREFSDDTARTIDQEIHRILSEAFRRATGILEENREKLDQLSVALLESETLDKADVTKVLGPPIGGTGHGDTHPAQPIV
ncbi:MAG: ATP-dependent zinc metalloprotease FtsH [Planctomycetaceae bacterium]